MRLAPAVCLVALAGCAGKPPAPPDPPPAPPPIDAAGSFDGLYRGTSTRYQADVRTCPGPGLITLRVQDGAFDYRWSPRLSLQVRIAGDRSLTLAGGGPNGDVTMSGRAAPGVIEGDVSNPACAFHFTARRRG